MEFICQKCEWEETTVYAVMAADGKASCWMYSPKFEPHVLPLENLFVSPEARNEERGRKALRFCEEVAREHGYEKIDLKACRDTWMQKWYEREGYDVFGPDLDEPMKYVWMEKYMSDEDSQRVFA